MKKSPCCAITSKPLPRLLVDPLHEQLPALPLKVSSSSMDLPSQLSAAISIV
jgi:hypothetical protein